MPPTISSLPPCPPLVPLLLPSASPSLSPLPTPQLKIYTQPDLERWPTSSGYIYLTATILRLVYAARGRSNAAATERGEAVQHLVKFLRQAKDSIKDVPLQTVPQRFGNKAFRDWVNRVEQDLPTLLAALLPLSPLPSSTASSLTPELTTQFLQSLGSPQRLDYGTGHELSFLLFLVVLFRLGILTERDEVAVVTGVFKAYLDAVREAQRVFRLEPAGSKGVWGLDDYQHLSYLFGASQLMEHPSFSPSQIPTPPSSLPAAASSSFPNHLHSSLTHLHTLKRGPFPEHSPLLYQISTTVPSYEKVTKGLWEMYKVEVLGKLPVVQHVRFGRGVPWCAAGDGGEGEGEELPSSGDGRRDEAGEGGGGEGDEGGASEEGFVTPAPWASTNSSSSLRQLPSTTSSFASSSSSSSSASSSFSRRQHPTSFPVPPPSSTSYSFAPPTLFPPRRPAPSTAAPVPTQARTSMPAPITTTQTGRLETTTKATTVADDGGAGAASSPFGVLPKARLG